MLRKRNSGRIIFPAKRICKLVVYINVISWGWGYIKDIISLIFSAFCWSIFSSYTYLLSSNSHVPVYFKTAVHLSLVLSF